MIKKPRSVCIQTWGCQMNAYDSLKIEGMLRQSGYAITGKAAGASVVILNTCAIREKAHEKVYSALGRLSKLKQEANRCGRTMRLVMVGCMAQATGQEIKKRIPALDWVVGTQALQNLPRLLEQGEKTLKEHHLEDATPEYMDFQTEAKLALWSQTITPLVRKTTALLSIQEGCSKFCTFCVVPYTRGEEVSRSVGDIVQEASSLAEQGVREITLLGQNVTAWHGTHRGSCYALCDLLAFLTSFPALKGILRWRYITGHPIDMTRALMMAHQDLPTLMPYVHVPLQAGDDAILKAMNRKHTAQEYLDMVEEMRSFCPDVALSSDFIVGFPGERESHFLRTMDMVKRVGFARAFSFLYSPRPGTTASYTKHKPEKPQILKKRLHQLQALLKEQQIVDHKKWLGCEVSVLLEGTTQDGNYWGRTPHFQKVFVKDVSSAMLGDVVQVQITMAETAMEGFALTEQKRAIMQESQEAIL